MFKPGALVASLIALLTPAPEAEPAPLTAETVGVYVVESPAPAGEAGVDVAAAPDVNAAVKKLQKTYENTRDFSASFTQRYTFTVMRRTQESKGTVMFKRPGLMRWDYSSPTEKSFVVESGKLWIVQPEDGTAMVDHCFKQDGLTASVSFLWGAGDIQKEFDAAWFQGVFGKKTDWHIQLTPKTPNKVFVRLILVVDPKTARVKQSIVVDPQGNVNQFIYDGLKFNKGQKTADFSPTLPKGTVVSRIPGSCAPSK